jgi:H+-transporting ATPase
MIVIMSLLDDVPILTIAYDNTPVSKKPIQWKMPRLLSVASVLGIFSIVQSFGLLLIGVRVLLQPHLQQFFGLSTDHQLQTMVFLQIVAGGPLLLFIARTEHWFWLPPYPARALFSAILLTQILAVLMCGFGWLVTPIPWKLIAWVWAYNLVWMLLLGGLRIVTELFIDHRTAHHIKSSAIVNQPLRAFTAHAAGKG